jgi:hypothetical protein
VRGNQSLAIDFNSAQLNDVLKSLTTIDLGDGRIGNVSFNTDAPLAQRLGALTLPVGEQTTLVDLLGALRGARLEVRDGGRLVSGRLLSVERRIRGKDEAPRDELTVVSDAHRTAPGVLRPRDTRRREPRACAGASLREEGGDCIARTGAEGARGGVDANRRGSGATAR